MDHGLGSLKCDQAADILLLLSSVHCRIKVLAELRSVSLELNELIAPD